MSKSVAFVSNFRMLLRRTNRRQFGCCGLRLTPVTTFALHLRPGHELQHRAYSSDDSDSKNKHKKHPSTGDDKDAQKNPVKFKYNKTQQDKRDEKQKQLKKPEDEIAVCDIDEQLLLSSFSKEDPINPEYQYLRTKILSAKAEKDDVFMEYVNGMPYLTVRLPSRNEMCQFALKPITHSVGDFLAMLKVEDRGIDQAVVINKHGVRIASTCSIESLLDDKFSIQINNRLLEVDPPKRDKITMEGLDKVGDVRKVIAQLYEAFNVGEYQLEKANEMARELENVRYELEPLEEKKAELSRKAARHTNVMTWVGLGLMSVQFGILARLTWWEYSWDIMEPVTYFVTYGTTMAMYAYYCVTKREYVMEEVKNREYILSLYKNAKKTRFDVEHYNHLKRKTAELEYNLRRLQDPLNLQLPGHLVRTQALQPPTVKDAVDVNDETEDKKLR